MSFASKEKASAWMIANQLSRRNLPPETISYLRGKKYHQEKTAGYGAKSAHQNEGQNQMSENQNTSAHQNEGQNQTALRLAKQYKVGKATIERDANERDAKFAADVDTLAEVVGVDIRISLLSRNAKLTKKQTADLANLAKVSPTIIKEAIAPETEV